MTALSSDRTDKGVLDVALLSTGIYFVIMTLYAVLIFVQFSVLEVLASAAWFGFLFLILFHFFGDDSLFRKRKMTLSRTRLPFSFFIALVLFIFSYSFPTKFINFYKTFPFLELYVGNDWSSDSSFHVSLIQSFARLGHPSTGLHNSPVIFYHTLSHFIDSLGVRLAGVSPYDSYGLFYHFKTWIILSFINVFVFRLFKTMKYVKMILALFFLLPLIMGTWHVIGSHGEWFPGVLVLASVYKVYSLLYSDKKLSTSSYLFLFFTAVIISLGKVSMGFSCAVFVGFQLLFKDFKEVRTYVLGVSWVMFFYAFHLALQAPGNFKNDGFDPISFRDLVEGGLSASHYQLLASNLFLIASLFVISKIKKDSSLRGLVSAYFLSFGVVFVICFSGGVLDHNGGWYFLHGLSIFGILYSVLGLVGLDHGNDSNLKIYVITATFFFAFNNPYFSIFDKTLFPVTEFSLNKANHIAIKGPTRFINKLAEGDKVGLFFLRSKRRDILKIYKESNLLSLENKVEKIISNNNLDRATTRIFIPKNVFLNEFQNYESKWRSIGFLLYSMTGVPLIHGVYVINYGYGFHNYTEEALWSDEIDLENCHGIEHIIKISSINRAEMALIACR